MPAPSSRPVPKLLTPGRIGDVEIRNRIVMPPMTTRGADPEGFVTEDTIAYYNERAEGGVGLITVEMASPEKAGKHRHNELGIYDDRFLPGLTRLVGEIHARGAKVAIQLGHGGGHTRRDITGGEPPVAPSAIPHIVQEGTTETIIPEAMSLARIDRAVDAFGEAARRAQRAGFDVVEIHGAHGYLISQFLAPAENLRDDAYGGSLENRARFALRIVERAKAAAPGLAVVLRLSGDDFFPGGMTADEAHQVAIWGAERGADAIHIAGGHYRSLPSGARMIPPMAEADAAFLHFAARLKPHVKVPVITVGRLGDPAAAIVAVESGKADFVALGRSLLADPRWVEKVRRSEPVRMCIACNTCVDNMREGQRLQCLVNPVTGHERAYGPPGPARDASLPRGRRIAVIGGGPAGLSYASLVAPDNQVTVFERDGKAGGAFRLAGLAPKFQGVEANPASLLRYVARLEERCRRSGVRFVFDADVGAKPELLEDCDLVVIAAGARYRAGLGMVPALLRSGLFRAGPFAWLAAHPGLRDWFYYRARLPAAPALARRFPDKEVIVIGDAARPGKSQAAIRSAFEAAYGLG